MVFDWTNDTQNEPKSSDRGVYVSVILHIHKFQVINGLFHRLGPLSKESDERIVVRKANFGREERVERKSQLVGPFHVTVIFRNLAYG